VGALTGPRSGEPDRRFTLTAQQRRVQLGSGHTIDAWTFDGQLPGPELRVRQGDLVEVTLVNRDIAAGVTLHWHGVDVPNAEDGVAGVTQDAVLPGQTHTYRFLAAQVGTFWYHSHQQSAEQVRRGLFGSFVIEPKGPQPGNPRDIALPFHTWEAGTARFATLGADDTLRREAVAPGTPVRLRLINTDNQSRTFALAGVPFQVAAIDGTDLNGPTDLTDARLPLGGGGRYDLTFVMPDRPVHLARVGGGEGAAVTDRSGLLLSPDGTGEPPALGSGQQFDPAHYGTPTATPFGATTRFDREFSLLIDERLGFYNGKFSYVYSINGALFPDTPSLVVKEGEMVKVTIVNRGFGEHPMHLHGHHVLVLSRNGEPVTGSPWWADTVNIAGGEWYEIALRADNPGVWMDHCHNLDHAAYGMVMHLLYAGVTTPYEVGPATPNQPE
jgi:FtsP/CotA-like multicopper oxidase with cupredoxin domain